MYSSWPSISQKNLSETKIDHFIGQIKALQWLSQLKNPCVPTEKRWRHRNAGMSFVIWPYLHLQPHIPLVSPLCWIFCFLNTPCCVCVCMCVHVFSCDSVFPLFKINLCCNANHDVLVCLWNPIHSPLHKNFKCPKMFMTPLCLTVKNWKVKSSKYKYNLLNYKGFMWWTIKIKVYKFNSMKS